MKNETSRSEKFANRYVTFLRRHYAGVLVVSLLLTALSALSAARFELRTSFEELLPQDEPSIQDLHRAKDRMGGLSNMIVAVEGTEPSTNRKLVDALVRKFSHGFDEYVYYLRYNIKQEKAFYEKHKHLYADLEDLKKIYERLKAKIRYERIKNNPVLALDFDGEEPEPVEFDVSDIRKKYEKKTSDYKKLSDGYFTTEQGRLYAILVYPPEASTGVDFSKKMLVTLQRAAGEVCGGTAPPGDPEMLEEWVNQACQRSYHPSIKVGWVGGIVTSIYEQQAIVDDLVLVTCICLFFVGLVVLLYFRSVRSLPTIGLPLIMGTTWTFGISIYIVEHLNTSTAFLAAIIVGNGINFGLIQLARYNEERRAGHNLEDALAIALLYTAKATSVAALAASIAYGSLIITRFRGFNGFGYMGGLGMLLCWFSAFSVQPAFLLLCERIRPQRFRNRLPFFKSGLLFTPFSRFVERYRVSLHLVGWVLAVVCITVAIPYLKDPFEYDFRNLRNQTVRHVRGDLTGRIDRIFPRRLNPLFILADRADQVPLIMEELQRKNSSGPQKGLFQEIRSVYTLLPTQQKQKIQVLKRTRKLLTRSTLSWLSDEDRAEIDKYIPKDKLQPLTPHDLPLSMTRLFTEKNGQLGLPIAMYPRHGRSTWDGHFLIEISEASRAVHLPDGETVTSAGVATIFADMIRAIERDGPRAVIASLLGVLILVVFAYRKTKYILVTLVALFFGVVLTIGPVALLDLKLNFLNFIGLPITFGIGIDYAVNILNRYRIEGPGSMKHAIATTGGAVALCSLTTLIGYSSLLIANNQALVSFGLLADIGEVASLCAAVLLLPVLVMTLDRSKRQKAKDAAETL